MSSYSKPLAIITTIGSIFFFSGCVIAPDQSRPYGSSASSYGPSGQSGASRAPQASVAESACMAKINSNYGGKVDTLKVVRSEFSQANTEVIVDAVGVRGENKTERWRCLSSNDGRVADLSIVQE